MAIFSNINEDYDMFDESGDILDSMIESCNDLLDALGSMEESTATQRHFGVTTKDFQRNMNFSDDEIRKLSNKRKEGTVNHLAKKRAEGSDDKLIDDYVDPVTGKGFSNTEKVRKKAATRGIQGYYGKISAKTGVDVKGIYDKAHEKAEKKKVIKETCLAILSALDEI